MEGNNFTTTGVSQNTPVFPNTLSPATVDAMEACFITPELGSIVAASAGGLILCLLISTILLAGQVCRLKRQSRGARPARSNADLVSGTGYWGTGRGEGGIVGPCEPSSVMLEEVKMDEEEGEGEGAAEDLDQSFSTDVAGGEPENGQPNMQSSSSRDSCLDVKDLEDMPLVV